MGLFAKLFGSEPKETDVSIRWLNAADNVYRRSVKKKKDDGLIEYFTAQCASRIMERVRLGESSYDGIDRYMNVLWNKIESLPEADIYEKRVEYDNVKMAHGVTVPVGDSFSEKWLVIYDNSDKNRIADVRRLNVY